MKNANRLPLLALLLAPLTACQSSGYMSSVALTGAESRNQVAESISEGVAFQRTASQEFETAGRMLLGIQTASEAEAAAMYSEYLDQIDRCARQVDRYGEQLVTVESGAGELFAAWEQELEQFSSEAIREQSSNRLDAARSGFALLFEEMTSVHGQMVSTLSTHKDYALYFNHNLAASSRELLGAQNDHFVASMAAMAAECGVVESDARTFNERLAGAPAVETTVEPTPKKAAKKGPANQNKGKNAKGSN